MCGRIFCLFNTKREFVAAIDQEIEVKVDDSQFVYQGPNYNIPPTTSIPILDSSNKLTSKPWGFRVGSLKHLVINARNEEVETKKSFKNLIDHHRCVIICSGYYEWKTTGLKDSNKKLPYSFKPQNNSLLFIAALRDPETDSVVLMTRDAAPSISHIHTRMPVILRKEDVTSKWLNHSKYTFSQLQTILIDPETYPSYIQYNALAPNVNSVKINGPECLESLEDAKEKSFARGIGKFFPKTKKPKVFE